jgi:hypothetical protein
LVNLANASGLAAVGTVSNAATSQVSGLYHWTGVSSTLANHVGIAGTTTNASTVTGSLTYYNGKTTDCSEFTSTAFWSGLGITSTDWDLSKIGQGFLPFIKGTSQSRAFNCMTTISDNVANAGNLTGVGGTIWNTSNTLTRVHKYPANSTSVKYNGTLSSGMIMSKLALNNGFGKNTVLTNQTKAYAYDLKKVDGISAVISDNQFEVKYVDVNAPVLQSFAFYQAANSNSLAVSYSIVGFKSGSLKATITPPSGSAVTATGTASSATLAGTTKTFGAYTATLTGTATSADGKILDLNKEPEVINILIPGGYTFSFQQGANNALSVSFSMDPSSNSQSTTLKMSGASTSSITSTSRSGSINLGTKAQGNSYTATLTGVMNSGATGKAGTYSINQTITLSVPSLSWDYVQGGNNALSVSYNVANSSARNLSIQTTGSTTTSATPTSSNGTFNVGTKVSGGTYTTVFSGTLTSGVGGGTFAFTETKTMVVPKVDVNAWNWIQKSTDNSLAIEQNLTQTNASAQSFTLALSGSTSTSKTINALTDTWALGDKVAGGTYTATLSGTLTSSAAQGAATFTMAPQTISLLVPGALNFQTNDLADNGLNHTFSFASASSVSSTISVSGAISKTQHYTATSGTFDIGSKAPGGSYVSSINAIAQRTGGTVAGTYVYSQTSSMNIATELDYRFEIKNNNVEVVWGGSNADAANLDVAVTGSGTTSTVTNATAGSLPIKAWAQGETFTATLNGTITKNAVAGGKPGTYTYTGRTITFGVPKVEQFRFVQDSQNNYGVSWNIVNADSNTLTFDASGPTQTSWTTTASSGTHMFGAKSPGQTYSVTMNGTADSVGQTVTLPAQTNKLVIPSLSQFGYTENGNDLFLSYKLANAETIETTLKSVVGSSTKTVNPDALSYTWSLGTKTPNADYAGSLALTATSGASGSYGTYSFATQNDSWTIPGVSTFSFVQFTDNSLALTYTLVKSQGQNLKITLSGATSSTQIFTASSETWELPDKIAGKTYTAKIEGTAYGKVSGSASSQSYLINQTVIMTIPEVTSFDFGESNSANTLNVQYAIASSATQFAQIAVSGSQSTSYVYSGTSVTMSLKDKVAGGTYTATLTGTATSACGSVTSGTICQAGSYYIKQFNTLKIPQLTELAFKQSSTNNDLSIAWKSSDATNAQLNLEAKMGDTTLTSKAASSPTDEWKLADKKAGQNYSATLSGWIANEANRGFWNFNQTASITTPSMDDFEIIQGPSNSLGYDWKVNDAKTVNLAATVVENDIEVSQSVITSSSGTNMVLAKKPGAKYSITIKGLVTTEDGGSYWVDQTQTLNIPSLTATNWVSDAESNALSFTYAYAGIENQSTTWALSNGGSEIASGSSSQTEDLIALPDKTPGGEYVLDWNSTATSSDGGTYTWDNQYVQNYASMTEFGYITPSDGSLSLAWKMADSNSRTLTLTTSGSSSTSTVVTDESGIWDLGSRDPQTSYTASVTGSATRNCSVSSSNCTDGVIQIDQSITLALPKSETFEFVQSDIHNNLDVSYSFSDATKADLTVSTATKSETLNTVTGKVDLGEKIPGHTYTAFLKGTVTGYGGGTTTVDQKISMLIPELNVFSLTQSNDGRVYLQSNFRRSVEQRYDIEVTGATRTAWTGLTSSHQKIDLGEYQMGDAYTAQISGSVRSLDDGTMSINRTLDLAVPGITNLDFVQSDTNNEFGVTWELNQATSQSLKFIVTGGAETETIESDKTASTVWLNTKVPGATYTVTMSGTATNACDSEPIATCSEASYSFMNITKTLTIPGSIKLDFVQASHNELSASYSVPADEATMTWLVDGSKKISPIVSSEISSSMNIGTKRPGASYTLSAQGLAIEACTTTEISKDKPNLTDSVSSRYSPTEATCVDGTYSYNQTRTLTTPSEPIFKFSQDSLGQLTLDWDFEGAKTASLNVAVTGDTSSSRISSQPKGSLPIGKKQGSSYTGWINGTVTMPNNSQNSGGTYTFKNLQVVLGTPNILSFSAFQEEDNTLSVAWNVQNADSVYLVFSATNVKTGQSVTNFGSNLSKGTAPVLKLEPDSSYVINLSGDAIKDGHEYALTASSLTLNTPGLKFFDFIQNGEDLSIGYDLDSAIAASVSIEVHGAMEKILRSDDVSQTWDLGQIQPGQSISATLFGEASAGEDSGFAKITFPATVRQLSTPEIKDLAFDQEVGSNRLGLAWDFVNVDEVHVEAVVSDGGSSTVTQITEPSGTWDLGDKSPGTNYHAKVTGYLVASDGGRLDLERDLELVVPNLTNYQLVNDGHNQLSLAWEFGLAEQTDFSLSVYEAKSDQTILDDHFNEAKNSYDLGALVEGGQYFVTLAGSATTAQGGRYIWSDQTFSMRFPEFSAWSMDQNPTNNNFAGHWALHDSSNQSLRYTISQGDQVILDKTSNQSVGKTESLVKKPGQTYNAQLAGSATYGCELAASGDSKNAQSESSCQPGVLYLDHTWTASTPSSSMYLAPGEFGSLLVGYELGDSIAQTINLSVTGATETSWAYMGTTGTLLVDDYDPNAKYVAQMQGTATHADGTWVYLDEQIGTDLPSLTKFQFVERDNQLMLDYAVAETSLVDLEVAVSGATTTSFAKITQPVGTLIVGPLAPGSYQATLTGQAKGPFEMVDLPTTTATHTIAPPAPPVPPTPPAPAPTPPAPTPPAPTPPAPTPPAPAPSPTPTETVYPIINQIPEADGMKFTFTDTGSVAAARAADIDWLAKTGVTVGSGCVNGQGSNCKYMPNSAVNRGAMAQFLQKLAGWTDSQIEARYAGKDTKLADIGSLKSTNPARYYAIMWLADTGITAGCNAEGTAFCPSNSVNRGAMAEFMQKFAGVTPVAANSSNFPDVTSKGVTLKYDGTSKSTKVPALSANRIGAINWMGSTGITAGSGAAAGKTTYRPQDPVNRGAMAQFMRKLATVVK